MVAKGRGSKSEVDRDDIKIQKKQGGSIADTELVSGIILDKEPVHSGMPREVSKAKVALIDTSLEIKKTEIESKIRTARFLTFLLSMRENKLVILISAMFCPKYAFLCRSNSIFLWGKGSVFVSK